MGYKHLKFPENSTFLVTGGAGFIGSNLCQAILEMGYKVRCLDNLSTGKKSNMDEFIDNPDFTFIEGDIRDLDTCVAACEGVDYVLNQAAWGSVPRSIEMPLLYEDINIGGTLNMMEAARRCGVKKFVYASSSSVYGDNTNIPLKETEYPLPKSPYAASKASCELYLKTYHEAYGLNYVSLRYFNVFGPKQDKNSQYAAVIPNFISALLEGEKPIIYGDGEQTRDFIYVKDVVKANIKSCECDYNGIVNVASGRKMTINELYRIICETLGYDVEAEYLPERKGDIKHSLADVSKMKKINYEVDLEHFENQLKETINWFKN